MFKGLYITMRWDLLCEVSEVGSNKIPTQVFSWTPLRHIIDTTCKRQYFSAIHLQPDGLRNILKPSINRAKEYVIQKKKTSYLHHFDTDTEIWSTEQMHTSNLIALISF